MDDDECDRVVDEARALVPRAAAVHCRRRSRVDAGHHPRREARGRSRCRCRPRSHTWIFQITDDWRCVRAYYTAVADASPVPVLLYNFTALTGVNLLPATVAHLARHENIVGMKESGSDISQIADLVASTPKTFSVLAGSGSTLLSRAVRGCIRWHSCAGRAPAGTMCPAL